MKMSFQESIMHNIKNQVETKKANSNTDSPQEKFKGRLITTSSDVDNLIKQLQNGCLSDHEVVSRICTILSLDEEDELMFLRLHDNSADDCLHKITEKIYRSNLLSILI